LCGRIDSAGAVRGGGGVRQEGRSLAAGATGSGDLSEVVSDEMKERMFFFEKKNQKTFICFGQRRGHIVWRRASGQLAKVFCFFFSKKKTFLP
jgi:hypothetical protein